MTTTPDGAVPPPTLHFATRGATCAKRLALFLPLLIASLAGCEQARPPSPAVVAARTATGTVATKFETKTQPEPPRAGTTSIWNFKVFDVHNKEDGTRKEWKFFKALPQSATDKGTTQVLMNAWLISKDKDVFLPQKPTYGQYGSFLTDWNIPRSGQYILFAEYQPVVAKDELSPDDLKGSKALPIEHARWEVAVGGQASVVPAFFAASTNGGLSSAWSLDASDYGTRAPFTVALAARSLAVGVPATLAPKLGDVIGVVTEQSVTALSPDTQTLLHAVGAAPQLTFTQRGVWRVWFTFRVDGKPFAASFDLTVR